MFAIWVRATLMRKPEYRIVLPQLDDLLELNVMLADRVEEWALGYKAQGMQQGVQKGEVLALQKLLTKKFCAIPSDVLAKIAGATPEQVDAWLDQVLDAKSLRDMFGSTSH